MNAQTLRVRLVDEVSRQPVAGALVIALDSAGNASATALSSNEGIAAFRVRSSGTYRAYIRRIGFAPFTSEPIGVGVEAGAPTQVIVPARRIQLATVRISARRACDGTAPSVSADAQPIWEEVKKALESSTVTRDGMLVTTAGVVFERRVGLDGRIERTDTTARGSAGSRPFTAADPRSLEFDGYVRGNRRLGFEFYAPDERVLLSDGFVRMHCLSLSDSVRRTGTRVLLGLGFEPRTNNQVSDIRGTLWVDSASAELARLDFRYARAPLPMDVDDIGGHVTFDRTSSGAWIVSGWIIRMPHWHTSNIERVGVRLDGHSEIGGSAHVTREVVALSPHVKRVISGSVFDSASGLAMVGARVRLPDLNRETKTDFMGRFRFDDLGIGVHTVSAEGLTNEWVTLPPSRVEADVIAAVSAEVTLGLPGFVTLWTKACPTEAAPSSTATLVLGRVTWAITRQPDSAAMVEMSHGGDPSKGVRMTSTRTDESGRFVACGSGGSTLSIHAAHDSASSESLSIRIPAGRTVFRRDLTLVGPAGADIPAEDSSHAVPLEPVAGATITGTVRDSASRPVRNVRVRVSGVAAETRTDANGRFTFRGVPAGFRIASATAIGFEPAARAVDVYAGDSATIGLRVTRLTTLAAARITERERVNALRTEITSRVVAAHGYMFDSTKLAKVLQLSQAFTLPGTRVRTRGSSFIIEVQQPGFLISPNNPESYCVPAVYIDDVALGFDQLNQVPKDNIALIEYYNRVANAPLKYTGTGSLGHSTTSISIPGLGVGVVKSACGVVLVWTKAFLSVSDPTRRRP